MKDYKLIINTHSKKYPIYVGYNILKSSKRIFKKNNIQIKKCLIVKKKILFHQKFFFILLMLTKKIKVWNM